jgi:hypothetical protein
MTIYECLKVSDNILISLPICTCIFPYNDNVRVLEKNWNVNCFCKPKLHKQFKSAERKNSMKNLEYILNYSLQCNATEDTKKYIYWAHSDIQESTNI